MKDDDDDGRNVVFFILCLSVLWTKSNVYYLG